MVGLYEHGTLLKHKFDQGNNTEFKAILLVSSEYHKLRLSSYILQHLCNTVHCKLPLDPVCAYVDR
jgi:hypothetical protein